MKVVSFDVWNTLLNTTIFYRKIALQLSRIVDSDAEEILDRILKVYRKIKLMRVREAIDENRVVEHSMEILLEQLDGIRREHVVKSIVSVVVSDDLKDLMIDDSLDIVSKLAGKNYTIITIGNLVFWPGIINRIILEKLGYAKYFKVQIYADEVKCSKPRPCIFNKALEMLEELGVKPIEIYHVGDSFREDFIGALGAGFKAILVDRNGEYCSVKICEVFKNRAYIISDLSQIMSIL